MSNEKFDVLAYAQQVLGEPDGVTESAGYNIHRWGYIEVRAWPNGMAHVDMDGMAPSLARADYVPEAAKALIHQLAGHTGRFVLSGEQPHPCDREARVQALARELLPACYTKSECNGPEWAHVVGIDAIEIAEAFYAECDKRDGQQK